MPWRELSGAQRAGVVGLVALMAIGSIFMWLGIPALWVLLASEISPSSTPSLGVYLLLLFGIPTTMIAFGRQLAWCNHALGDLTGRTPRVRVAAPWHRSVRGGRDEGHSRRVLDVVMVTSVALALLALGVWFALFAHGGGI